ncbi:uncharacterized protein BCR38DRAFT_437181 [Pseudomassariella vexata]|uniref:RNase MRP protein 1 RNA binding domain-containing protein n=1 Tax=Pseudomassariella vexata TaxID=1141098 RepID=A0A1Y2DWA1_9PEZI|nr:uncharacterized protein BCR38DRAFT_437181 [Pseudomassariella vexata]ORY63570.1 hypothetical protein BCR38DRAFT_437181 [Pseudomassariella vexata]
MPVNQHVMDTFTSGKASADPQKALDLLQPLQPILAGFNHRNKNQHRGARWWGSFGMLRRNLEKLVDEVADAVDKAAAAGGKKRKPAAVPSKKDGRSGRNAAETRASWLRGVLVPKLYVAFSQLTADNQFATLGLMLFGVLAQVNAACAYLIVAGDDAQQLPESGVATTVPLVTKKLQPVLGIVRDGKEDTVDLGRAVSREEIAREVAMRREAEAAEGVAVPTKKRRKEEAFDARREKIQRTEEDSMVEKAGRGEKDKSSAPKEKEKKKKKKKGKKGDEFDDLFSSLF